MIWHTRSCEHSRGPTTICRYLLRVELWPFDLDSGVRVTCDVGYLCANFSLPKPLCSQLRPNVCDRQMSDAHHRFTPPLWGRDI